MKRTNIYIPERMWKELAEKAKKLEISVSELIRRIVDEWLGNKTKSGRGGGR